MHWCKEREEKIRLCKHFVSGTSDEQEVQSLAVAQDEPQPSPPLAPSPLSCLTLHPFPSPVSSWALKQVGGWGGGENHNNEDLSSSAVFLQY